MRRTVERTCPRCEGSFVVDSDYPGRKFCSRACAYAARRQRSSVERTCRTCGREFMAKRAEVRRRRDGVAYCSRACWRANPPRDTQYSAEAAARMRERRGSANPAFNGDAITVGSAHDRVRSLRGNAREHPCSECDAPARDWALRRDATERREATNGRAYSLRVEDYIPLCRRCHVHYDRDGAFPRYFGANAHLTEGSP